MWQDLSAIGGAVTFIFIILRGLVKWGSDDVLERYYKATVESATGEEAYCSRALGTIAREVIVDSGRGYSPIRTFLKKKIAQFLHKRVPPVILVFNVRSEEDRKAYVIQKAFSSVTESLLLDTDFLETVICYRAYKFAHDAHTVDNDVRDILRRRFEACKYRESVVNLESPAFSERVVLNPPPERRPLLTNVLLPMAGEAERLIQAASAGLEVIEQYKSFFMQLIEQVCSAECAVIFVHERPKQEYVQWVDGAIDRFGSFIFAARGSYIKRMLLLYDQIEDNLKKKWAPKFASTSIAGKWEFPGGNIVSCQWMIGANTEGLGTVSTLPPL